MAAVSAFYHFTKECCEHLLPSSEILVQILEIPPSLNILHHHLCFA